MKSEAVKALEQQRRTLLKDLKGVERALVLVGGTAPKRRRRKAKAAAGGNRETVADVAKKAGKAVRAVSKKSKKTAAAVSDADLEEKRAKARALKGEE